MAKVPAIVGNGGEGADSPTPVTEQAARSTSASPKRIHMPDQNNHDGGGGDDGVELPASCKRAEGEPDVNGKEHGSPIEEKEKGRSGAVGSLKAPSGSRVLLSSPDTVLGKQRRSPSSGESSQEEGSLDGEQGAGVEGNNCSLTGVSTGKVAVDIAVINQSKKPRLEGNPPTRSARIPLHPIFEKESRLQVGSGLRPPFPFVPRNATRSLSRSAGIPTGVAPLPEPESTNGELLFSLEGVPSKRVTLWQEELVKLGSLSCDGKKPVTAPTSIKETMDRLTAGSRGWSRNDYDEVGNLDGNDFFDFEPVDENDLGMLTATESGSESLVFKLPEDLRKELDLTAADTKGKGDLTAGYPEDQPPKQEGEQRDNYFGKSPAADTKSECVDGQAELLQAEPLSAIGLYGG